MITPRITAWATCRICHTPIYRTNHFWWHIDLKKDHHHPAK